MSTFRSVGTSIEKERLSRKDRGANYLRYGIEYLDDATAGIAQDDLVLVGAPPGSGKTQLCCNIALANITDGRRVHYIALEAAEWEIERRLKYPLIAERYFADPFRKSLDGKRMSFRNWVKGELLEHISHIEQDVDEFMAPAFRDLFVMYKTKKFEVEDMIRHVVEVAPVSDLIVIDHVHYFDWEDDDNRAIKRIAMTARTLALEEQKPIILVAHLRKKDRANQDLVAGMDEFHGSSELSKVATTVITMAPGGVTPGGSYETFFRVPKLRLDGGVTRYIGRELFSPRRGGYELDKYQIGWSNLKSGDAFENLLPTDHPEWSRLWVESDRDGILVPQGVVRRPANAHYVPGSD